MKKLSVLLYKEWRDQRPLILGMSLVCALLVAVAKVLVGARFDSLPRARFVWPVCLGAFALILATEVVTRDVQNGAERTLAHLPVPRRMQWLAKVVFVTLASMAFCAFSAALECVILVLEHGSVVDGLDALVQPVAWLAIAAVTTACAASACVLRRSLPAAFVGIAMIVFVPLLAWRLPEGSAREWLDVVLSSWTPTGWAACALAAFLLAFAFAFAVRRPDPTGLRRAAAALLGLCIVGAPVLASTAHRARLAFDIELFSKSAHIYRVVPSPDGRFLAVGVQQRWRPRDRWLDLARPRTNAWEHMRNEVWILDLATNEWKEIDDRFRTLRGFENNWDDDGRLATTSAGGLLGSDGAAVERIDPVRGMVESTRSITDPDADLGHWYDRKRDGDDLVLSWRDRSVELRLPNKTRYLPSYEPGIVFHEQHDAIVRHDMASGEITTLAASRTPKLNLWEVAPDGRHLFARIDGEDVVLDAQDGHVVHRGDWLVEWSYVPGRIGIVRTEKDEWHLLREDGSMLALPAHPRRSYCELGEDRLIDFGSSRIECSKLDGSERRVLYEWH